MFERIATEAARLMRMHNKRTMTAQVLCRSRHISVPDASDMPRKHQAGTVSRTSILRLLSDLVELLHYLACC